VTADAGKTPDTPPPPPPPPAAGGDALTEDKVRALIREAMASGPAPSSRPGTAAAAGEDVAGQVQAAVERIRQADAQKAKDDAIAAQLKELQDKVAAGTKKAVDAPVAFKKITVRMWGDPPK